MQFVLSYGVCMNDLEERIANILSEYESVDRRDAVASLPSDITQELYGKLLCLFSPDSAMPVVVVRDQDELARRITGPIAGGMFVRFDRKS